jgi:serine/threonine-protein kinase HipA
MVGFWGGFVAMVTAYHSVAREAGVWVGAPVIFDADVLFVPRFDREPDETGVLRFGLESLASLSDVSSFGASVPMERLCGAISRFSSDPAADIREFVFRDVLNVAMGNTDNHGRNSAMLKTPDGAVRLSPIYDFAPMFLDDQGIPRICRWTGAESGGMPDWGDVAESLKTCGMDAKALRAELARFSGTVERLPEIMDGCGVDGWLIERLARRIEAVRDSLENAGPALYS